LDVHRARVEVTARVALREAEATYELDALATEVIVDARQLLVELGPHRADLTGTRAAKDFVELGERGVIEAAVGAVDVDLDLFAKVLGHHPDLPGGLRKRL